MKKFIGTRIIKTGIAVALALIISKAFGITSTFAGVVALIGLKQTTKKSIHYGTTLLLGSVISVFLGLIVGNYVGVGPVAFGIGTIIAIAILVALRLSDGLILSIVVMYHVLDAIPITLGEFWSFSLHELLIVFIGIAASVIVNLLAPQKFDQQLEQHIKAYHKQNQVFLHELAEKIKNPSTTTTIDIKVYQTQRKSIRALIEKANIGMENCLNITHYRQYEQYIYQLRKIQKLLNLIEDIATEVALLSSTHIHTNQVARAVLLLTKIEQSPEQTTDASYQRMFTTLRYLGKHFHSSRLPETREEFVDRSALYHIFLYTNEYIEVLYQLKKPKKKEKNSSKKRLQILAPLLGLKQ